MKRREVLWSFLVVGAIVAALPIAWARQVHAQGGPQTPPMLSGTGVEQEVRGMVRELDSSRRTLRLDDGTELTIPSTVNVPGGIKEGSIVKASFEEQGGQKVVISLEVDTP
jgi:hypothetical protein